MALGLQPAPAPSNLGPYRIIGQIGEGGMGVVYEAVHENIERRVAIKVLHPEYARKPAIITRFFNEARAVNRIEHAGLVQITDYAQLPDGTAYIVMEFLRGESLASRIRRSRLPLAAALNVAWQMADALSAAHAKSIIHRDLKPDNIMLVADKVAPGGVRVKLLDFGIAKLAAAAAEGPSSTRTNLIMGTPRYMSPEQCRGAREVDEKSDVYSLGVMLYQLLGGRLPFEEEGVGALLAQHMFEPPPPLGSLAPELPVPLIELVHRLLAKDRQKRPSMRELFEQLGPMVGLCGESPTTPSLPSFPESLLPTPELLLPSRGSTTLGQTPGQSIAGRTTRPRILVMAGLSGLLMLGGALALARRMSDAGRDAGSATAAPASEAAKPALKQPTVTWRVDSEPPGAAITRARDGALLGKTPWQGTQPLAQEVEELRLTLEGYQVREIILSRNASAELLARLDRKREQPTKAADESAPAPTPPPPKKTGRRRAHATAAAGFNGYKQEHGHGPVQLEN